MSLCFQNFGNDEWCEGGGLVLDGFDFDADIGKRGADGFKRGLRIQEAGEQGEREFHAMLPFSAEGMSAAANP